MTKRRCLTCGEFRGTWHSCTKALSKKSIPTPSVTPLFPLSHVKTIPNNRVASIVLEDMVIETGSGFEIRLTKKGEVYMQYVNTAGALLNRRALNAAERAQYSDYLKAAGHKVREYTPPEEDDEDHS